MFRTVADKANILFIMNLNKETVKKYKIPLIVGVFLLLSFVGGGSGWKYHKKALKAFEDVKLEEIKVLQDSMIVLNQAYEDALDKDTELTVIEKSYYNEFIRERRKRVEAERLLNSISDRVYSYSYLDSLKSNVTYSKE